MIRLNSNHCHNIITVFHPDGNLAYNPSLSALVSFLIEDGYIVEYLYNSTAESPRAESSCLRLTRISPLLRKFIALRRKLPWLSALLFRIGASLARLERPSLVIGVDRDGIILAAGYASIHYSPLALLSYEIYFASESGKDFKSFEIRACSNLSFAVCQDRVRSRLLSDENSIPSSKIINIPVSPSSSISSVPSSPFSLRETLGITQQYIALYSGSIARWAMMDELLDTLSSWPRNWALVLHGRYRLDSSIRLIDSLLQSNVYSTNGLVLDEESYVNIIRSVDLGLAFYNPTYESCSTGENIKSIGLSSGKVSCYLSQGIPVCINSIGELSDLVHLYGAGIVNPVEDIAGILPALDANILLRMRSAAYRLFEERLNADLYRSLFLSAVDSAVH